MAQTINIFPATQLNAGRMISVRVLVTEGATSLTDKTYIFDANTLSCAYDGSSVNSVVLHFGAQHVVGITNIYTSLLFNSVAKTNASDLAQSVIADIANYTT
jgi:hypothetical protein